MIYLYKEVAINTLNYQKIRDYVPINRDSRSRDDEENLQEVGKSCFNVIIFY